MWLRVLGVLVGDRMGLSMWVWGCDADHDVRGFLCPGI